MKEEGALPKVVDIGAAGTAMRFLTALVAATPHLEVFLTGSERMQERPIGALVEALRQLGADIVYAKNEGFLRCTSAESNWQVAPFLSLPTLVRNM